VRTFARRTPVARDDDSSLSELVRISATLSLSNLSYWQNLIRGEIAAARRASPVDPGSKGWGALFQRHHAVQRAEDSGVSWLDLANGDGHRREKALRTLVGPAPNAFFFALFVRRINDWVPQVRAAAVAKAPSLAEVSDPEHVVDTLCAVLPAWTDWGRLDESAKRALVALTAIAQVGQSLKHRLIFSSAGPMAAVLAQALRVPSLDADLVEIATRAIQPAVRARACRALVLGEAVWTEARRLHWPADAYRRSPVNQALAKRPLRVPPLLACVSLAAADRSSIVRRVAAQALVRDMDKLGEAVLPLARRFAGDSSRSVSERGVFVLRQRGASASE
jgi:hypothetical protein